MAFGRSWWQWPCFFPPSVTLFPLLSVLFFRAQLFSLWRMAEMTERERGGERERENGRRRLTGRAPTGSGASRSLLSGPRGFEVERGE